MNRREKAPRLELRLNVTIPRGGRGFTAAEETGAVAAVPGGAAASPNGSPSSSSSPSSCLSSESEQRYASSPEATSMILLGCPRCLMYVMLSEDDPKCPKCKSTVLLDFLNDPKNSVPATKKN